MQSNRQESFEKFYFRVKSTRYCLEEQRQQQQQILNHPHRIDTHNNNNYRIVKRNIFNPSNLKYTSNVNLLDQMITTGDILGISKKDSLVERSLYTSSENWIPVNQRSLMIKSEIQSMNRDCFQPKPSKLSGYSLKHDQESMSVSESPCFHCNKVCSDPVNTTTNQYRVPSNSIQNQPSGPNKIFNINVAHLTRIPFSLYDETVICSTCAEIYATTPQEYRPETARRFLLNKTSKKESKERQAAIKWDPLTMLEREIMK